MSKFTVQILTDEEFDSLPYKNVRNSIGVADPHKNLAFVRDTGVKKWNLETLSHEINHLVEKNGDHADEDGIMHKSGGGLGRIIAPIIGGLVTTLSGGALAPLGMAIGAAGTAGTSQYSKAKKPEKYGQPGQIGDILGSALTGGAGAYGAGQLGLGGVAGGTQAAPGFMSKAGGIISGALRGTPAVAGGPATTSSGVPVGATYTPPTSGLLGSGGSFLKSGTKASQAASAKWAAPSITGASGITPAVTSSVPGPQGGNILGQAQGKTPSAVSSFPNISGAAPGISPTTLPATSPKTPFSFKDLITPQNALGAASTLAGAASGTPEFQMPDSVEQLRSKLLGGEGLSPLGQQARTELGGILSSQPSQINAPAGDEYYADTNRRIDLQYDQARASLDAAYNNAGTLNSGEHLDQVRQLEEARANAKNAFVQSENQRRFEFGSNQKYNAIQSALGVDKNVMDDLVGLSGLDVTSAAIMYGAQAADVKAIREALGTIGSEALSRGQEGAGVQTGQVGNIINQLGFGGG